MKGDDKTCEHELCNCPKEPGSNVCSSYCEAAKGGDIEELLCGCGHSGCSIEVKPERIAS